MNTSHHSAASAAALGSDTDSVGGMSGKHIFTSLQFQVLQNLVLKYGHE